MRLGSTTPILRIAKGYKYARPGIEEMPWGRDMTVRDPFGNRLTFTMPA